MDAARDALGGTVDVYCANAGLASPGDAFADEEVWAAAWDVNVMAHVRAARALLPDWLERGSGRFVSTVVRRRTADDDRRGPVQRHQARGASPSPNGSR